MRNAALQNGLRIALEGNHWSPLIASALFVESDRATITSSAAGIAHLTEHAVFAAQRSVPEIEQLIEIGASNAFTTVDGSTYYHVALPGSTTTAIKALARTLRYQIVDGALIEHERRAITHELSKLMKDAANFDAERIIANHVFLSHRYAKGSAGTPESIDMISAVDVNEFIAKSYRVENSTLTVVGAFNENVMLKTIGQMFESPPADFHQPISRLPEDFVLRENGSAKAFTIRGLPSSFVEWDFLIADASPGDEYVLQIIENLLIRIGAGSLVREELEAVGSGGLSIASTADVHRGCTLSRYRVVTDQARKRDAIETALMRAMKRLSSGALPPRALSQAKTLAASETAEYSQSAISVCLRAISATYRYGEAPSILSILDAYEKVSPEDVADVASRLLQNANCVRFYFDGCASRN